VRFHCWALATQSLCLAWEKSKTLSQLPFCNKWWAQLYILSDHVERAEDVIWHPVEGSLQCSVCQELQKWKWSLTACG
jgi:hypothetical protein